MQCSNCQFQNMPGVQTCGRCGASLQLASLAIDVHPPRAGRAAKRWRRWFPVDQVLEPLPRRGCRPAGRQEGARLAGRPAGARPAPADDRPRLGAALRGPHCSRQVDVLVLPGTPVVGAAVPRDGAGLVAVGSGACAPRGVDHGHRGRKRPRFPPAADLLRRGNAAADGCRVLSRRLAAGTGGRPRSYSIWLRPRSRPETWCW